MKHASFLLIALAPLIASCTSNKLLYKARSKSTSAYTIHETIPLNFPGTPVISTPYQAHPSIACGISEKGVFYYSDATSIKRYSYADGTSSEIYNTANLSTSDLPIIAVSHDNPENMALQLGNSVYYLDRSTTPATAVRLQVSANSRSTPKGLCIYGDRIICATYANGFHQLVGFPTSDPDDITTIYLIDNAPLDLPKVSSSRKMFGHIEGKRKLVIADFADPLDEDEFPDMDLASVRSFETPNNDLIIKDYTFNQSGSSVDLILYNESTRNSHVYNLTITPTSVDPWRLVGTDTENFLWEIDYLYKN